MSPIAYRELCTSAYGIDDASSAMEAAIVKTNKHGINHPKTIPTCPPALLSAKGQETYLKGYIPDSRGNEKVDVTDATMPMIEKAKAMDSINYMTA